MMEGQPMRSWSGVFRWPGKKSFMFGTVFVRYIGTSTEVETELRKAFDEAWRSILPDDTPNPDLINMIPGMVIFVPEGGSNE